MNKVLNTVEVTKNSFHNDGDGIVSFPNGLVISDDQPQRNGTRYDINSLDISKYGGQLTADHEDKLKNIIGRVEGISKDGGKAKSKQDCLRRQAKPVCSFGVRLVGKWVLTKLQH